MRREATVDDKVAPLEAIFGLNQLASAERLEVETALGSLHTHPALIDAEVGETIEHARHCVAAVPGGDHKHEAVARYAVKRIALVLDRHLREA